MDTNNCGKQVVVVEENPCVEKTWDLPGLNLISDEDSSDSAEPIASEGPLFVGKIFGTKSELKTVVGIHALRECFETRVNKSCFERYEIVCKIKSCKFKIGAKRIGTTPCWQIRHYESCHTCGYEGASSHTATVQTIGTLMASRLQSSGIPLKPKQIISDVKNDWGVDCLYSKAWRSKELANSIVYGSPEESFDVLRRYFYVIEKKNPGTQTFLEVDSEGRFKCCFWAFGGSIEGAQYIRPVVAIDGTHLRGRFKGILFVAVGLDANGKTYPLAFGIGHKEDEFNWCWFLSKLRVSFGCLSDMVIVSDQHKAINLACAKIYPDAWHGLCGSHLVKNLKRDYKSDELVKFFKAARDSYKVTEFERNMTLLRNVSNRAYDFLMNLDPNMWARSMSPHNRFNIMTSNIAESMNARLKEARKMPITVLVEHVRAMMQKWFHDRYKLANATIDVLTPKVTKTVDKNVRSGRFLQVLPISEHVFQVKNVDTDEVVNLEIRTCSCKAFQLDKFVCKHAVAAILHCRGNIIHYCSDYYKKDNWKLQYKDAIRPVGRPEDWEIPEDVFHGVVKPPLWRGQAGRPREKRIRSVLEGTSKRHKKTCSICHSQGHYRQSCPNIGVLTSNAALEDTTQTQEIAKKKRACSICREFGHRKNTCPKVLGP